MASLRWRCYDIVEYPERSSGPPPRPGGLPARELLISYPTLYHGLGLGNPAAKCEVIFARALRFRISFYQLSVPRMIFEARRRDDHGKVARNRTALP
jgi:hypothetical protein